VTVIAILGLGEAGRAYAHGLRDAGASVRGFDPHRRLDGDGVVQAADVASAVAGADLVLSLAGAAAAEEVAAQALAAMTAPAVYADLNTTAPEVKARIAARAGSVPTADAAVLAPVHRDGHRTELLASGAGAAEFARILAGFGVPVTVLDAAAGEAARLKLLRSVFMKGLAALVFEGTTAARAAGAEEWLRGQIARELGPGGEDLVARFLEGTPRHAERRVLEVRDALAELEASGLPSDMTRATLAWLERLRDAP